MIERDAEPISDPGAGSTGPARAEVRLRLKPHTAARGQVDGAWWPRSHVPAAEFPGLVLAMSSSVGPVRQVAYHLDDWDSTTHQLIVEGWSVELADAPTLEANTVVVTGSDERRMILLVVPPGTPGGVARAVLRSTATAGTVASAEDILASNGVPLGGRIPRRPVALAE
jgi:hypothetical protein